MTDRPKDRVASPRPSIRPVTIPLPEADADSPAARPRPRPRGPVVRPREVVAVTPSPNLAVQRPARPLPPKRTGSPRRQVPLI